MFRAIETVEVEAVGCETKAKRRALLSTSRRSQFPRGSSRSPKLVERTGAALGEPNTARPHSFHSLVDSTTSTSVEQSTAGRPQHDATSPAPIKQGKIPCILLTSSFPTHVVAATTEGPIRLVSCINFLAALSSARFRQTPCVFHWVDAKLRLLESLNQSTRYSEVEYLYS